MSHIVRPLHEADFRLTCDNGFGDGWNHYAHSMAWFRGRLYVGTTRATMAMNKYNIPRPPIRPWPVDCPDDVYEVPRQAEIWEYTPETDSWLRVYQAPLVKGRNGRMVPRYIGLRGITVFQGPQDPAPCLYVSTWAPMLAEPPDILRSENGRDFGNVPRPPWAPTVRSFRTLQIFKGRVHTTPTHAAVGVGRAQDAMGSEATIYACDDLSTGQWLPANPEGFGRRANATIFEMAVFDDHLYAVTVNPLDGLELWKTPGGDLPYQWTRVLTRGAGRGALNETGGCLCEFNGALYVGTGIANGGYHRAVNVGPAAAELLRVWPDDSWDLLMGESRLSDEGVRYPLSGYAPGFDSLFNGYLWRMGVHEGHLYVGTFNWANMLPYLPTHTWPEDVLAMVHRWGEENILRRFAGAELWRSADGLRWAPVTRSGFGNKYNWGVRNLVSTPHGLFVGTANPFGPTVAQRIDRERWQYVPNARGGCEVLLGVPGSGAAAAGT